MSNNIRIGLSFDPGETGEVQNNFSEQWKNYQAETGNVGPELIFSSTTSTTWMDDILKDKIDVACLPLEDAPFELPGPCFYFAMKTWKASERKIICHPDFFSPADDLKMKPGTVVAVFDENDGILLQHLNPAIQLKTVNRQILRDIQDGGTVNFQALLLDNAAMSTMQIPAGFLSVNIHPDEFPEKAGSGKIVFGGHRDTASILKAVHACFQEKEIVSCANIEREIAKKFISRGNISLRVRCRKDDRNNYHVKAAVIDFSSKKLFQHAMSQSTHFKLAEKMIDVLSQNL